MNKAFPGLLVLLFLLASCGAKKETPAPTAPATIDTTITYTNAVAPMISSHCGICHIDIVSGGVSFDSYSNVVAHIDRMIARTSAGTMPPAGHAPLSASQVDTLRIWRASGEKQ